ncbi:hypothetical protein J1N35_001771 [Gossypium stocksii]|uniref:Uncharacterized protein n=1 Tax=Gossypium stocksii TaxID=47602 RepID=A0A9D3WKY7_9ROSI|nr:hypothetical protein J1N35_001771 [Gossypium stocksii]
MSCPREKIGPTIIGNKQTTFSSIITTSVFITTLIDPKHCHTIERCQVSPHSTNVSLRIAGKTTQLKHSS